MNDKYVGIDMAKKQLDLAIRPSGERRVVNRDEPGLAALVKELVAEKPALIVLEATGGLEVSVVSALLQAELPVVVVNPRQVRDFAKATGRLAKTDQLDAAFTIPMGTRSRILARRSSRPRARCPPNNNGNWMP